MPASKIAQQKAAKRREDAFRLRISGLTYEAIAKQLRTSDWPAYSAGRAHDDVKQALAERQQLLDSESAHFVAIEAERLDNAERTLNTTILMASAAQPRDDATILAATDRLLRVMERRARLLGLDSDPANKPHAEDELDKRRAMREQRVGHVRRGAG